MWWRTINNEGKSNEAEKKPAKGRTAIYAELPSFLQAGVILDHCCYRVQTPVELRLLIKGFFGTNEYWRRGEVMVQW